MYSNHPGSNAFITGLDGVDDSLGILGVIYFKKTGPDRKVKEFFGKLDLGRKAVSRDEEAVFE